MNKNTIKVLFFILALLGSIILYNFHSTREAKIYKVAIMDWAGFYPAIHAVINNEFKSEDFSVDLVFCKDNPEINSKLVNSEVDLAFGTFADFVLLNGQGAKIKFVMITDYSRSDALLVDKKVSNLNDVSTRPIGIGDMNSFSEFFIISIFKEKGITENALHFKSIPFGKIVTSIEEGKILSGHTWEPELSTGQKKGMKILLSSKDFPGIVTDGLAANSFHIENNAHDLKKIVSTFLKASELAKSNPDLIAEKISDYLNIPKETVRNRLKSDVYLLSKEENLTGLNYKNNWSSLSWQYDIIYDFFKSRGQLNPTINRNSLIDFDLIPLNVGVDGHEI